jgi:hypothetical protein
LEIAVENGEAIPSCLGFYIVEQSPPYLVWIVNEGEKHLFL